MQVEAAHTSPSHGSSGQVAEQFSGWEATDLTTNDARAATVKS